MDQNLREKVTSTVNFFLDRAERHWKDKGRLLLEGAEGFRIASAALDQMPSNIPNHPIVDGEKVVLDEFIVLVADMRGSTNHLLCAISDSKTKIPFEGVKRIYYETSALLPALNETITYYKGSVTEYLGDGVLALFHYEGDDSIYKAKKAANDIILEMRNIINCELSQRYGLPEIHLGVGMALSKCLVTQVGSPGNMQPKVFGESVYRATKLSDGDDLVRIDQPLRMSWPKSSGGTLRFRPVIGRSFPCFTILEA